MNSSTAQVVQKQQLIRPGSSSGDTTISSSSIDSVSNDLKSLPETIPPLLGRQAISSRKSHSTSDNSLEISGFTWTLEWGSAKYTVRVHNTSSLEKALSEDSVGKTYQVERGRVITSNPTLNWSCRSEQVEVRFEDLNHRDKSGKRYVFISF